jgi:pimeloyl-ACP methyl ester carboxylesterase
MYRRACSDPPSGTFIRREADTLVPAAMGRYQAAEIPRCHFTLLPGEGHLLIIDRMPDLAAALRPAAPPRSPGES